MHAVGPAEALGHAGCTHRPYMPCCFSERLLLWDPARSAAAVEVPWPSGFQCKSLARLSSDHLVAGGSGEVPVHYIDFRMPSSQSSRPDPWTSIKKQVFYCI